MFKIETWENNKILRKIADNISKKDFKKYLKLGKKMIAYIKDPDNWWVGLAAPQIWKSISMFVVSLPKNWDDENYKTIIIINPKILEYWDEIENEEEWCLSLPGIKKNVDRPNLIKIEFFDENNKKQVMIYEWLQARIIQHEYDHLIWKLFIDY
jgi:peptide deformylase